MTHPRLALFAAAFALAAALSSCGGDDAPPAATKTAAPPSPTATLDDGSASGVIGKSGGLVRSRDGRLEIGSKGDTEFEVTIRPQLKPVEAPRGWEFTGPVYDISARQGGRNVTQLAQPFDLAFRHDGGAATAMYFDGKAWVIVESTLDSSGNLTATTDHLTPYAVARPTRAQATPTASASPTGVATGTVSPSASASASPSGDRTPAATISATATAVSPAAARTALEPAIEKYKGKLLHVSNAGGATGAASIALPRYLQKLLDEAASANGEVYYGVYNAVNEALTATISDGSRAGTLTVLIEPRTTFPASASEAQQLLAELFPGALGPSYTGQEKGADGYTFWAKSSGTSYALGYVMYEGLPIAFLAAGTDAWSSSVVTTALLD